jgi:RecB family exonuclease
VDFSSIVGQLEQFGTADAIVVGDGELTIVDLKTGFRPVDATNNTQLMTYALGALAKLVGEAQPDAEAPSDDDLF